MHGSRRSLGVLSLRTGRDAQFAGRADQDRLLTPRERRGVGIPWLMEKFTLSFDKAHFVRAERGCSSYGRADCTCSSMCPNGSGFFVGFTVWLDGLLRAVLGLSAVTVGIHPLMIVRADRVKPLETVVMVSILQHPSSPIHEHLATDSQRHLWLSEPLQRC